MAAAEAMGEGPDTLQLVDGHLEVLAFEGTKCARGGKAHVTAHDAVGVGTT
jgi:hypothetical protein